MIQRIQTLYLLAVVSLMVTSFFTPAITWIGANGELYTLTSFALEDINGAELHSTIYLGLLMSMATLLPLITIFLFKNRLLQIRLCAVEMVLILGVVAVKSVYYFLSERLFEGLAMEGNGFIPAILLSILPLLFMYLAVRAIFRDEMMVRASNRIR